MSVTPAAQDASPGEVVSLRTHIVAENGAVSGIEIVNITASPESAAATISGDCPAPFDDAGCTVGKLESGDHDEVASTVSIPKSAEKTVTVTVTVTVSATGLTDQSSKATITYVVPTPTPTPTKTTSPPPSTSPSATPTKTTPKPSPTKSSSGGGGGSGGGDGSSGGSSSGSGSGDGGPSASISGVEPPNPNSSFDPQKPQVALPPIQAPSPSVAPGLGTTTPQSRLQGNKAPVAQDLTFERMASTQVAWLAALLVAVSLLLTQLRLGRRRLPAGAAKRLKGTHRRPKKGMFGS
ncbi:hypothetical protein [Spirillospora sp. NPDC048819]|uniref:hypothetical protein n=1 Tax=Spirillospora sp. NPDC048819 TaxID=3155268 RepID=UPI0033C9CB78